MRGGVAGILFVFIFWIMCSWVSLCILVWYDVSSLGCIEVSSCFVFSLIWFTGLLFALLFCHWCFLWRFAMWGVCHERVSLVRFTWDGVSLCGHA